MAGGGTAGGGGPAGGGTCAHERLQAKLYAKAQPKPRPKPKVGVTIQGPPMLVLSCDGRHRFHTQPETSTTTQTTYTPRPPIWCSDPHSPARTSSPQCPRRDQYTYKDVMACLAKLDTLPPRVLLIVTFAITEEDEEEERSERLGTPQALEGRGARTQARATLRGSQRHSPHVGIALSWPEWQWWVWCWHQH